MAKGWQFQTDVLNFAFGALGVSSISASGGTTSLWIALHSADPSGGTQATNELSTSTFTNYARKKIDRSTANSSGFLVTAGTSGGTAASLNFAAVQSYTVLNTSSTGLAQYASIGHSSSGTGKIYYSAAFVSTAFLFQYQVVNLTTSSSITES